MTDSNPSKRNMPDGMLLPPVQKLVASLIFAFGKNVNRVRIVHQLIIASVSRVRIFLICQAGKVIHAGVQRQGDSFALLKGIISFAAFDLGIVALIDAGQHLHLDLGEPSLFPQFLQSWISYISNYARMTY